MAKYLSTYSLASLLFRNLACTPASCSWSCTLADFHEKITPFLAVERKQPAFLGFLRNRQVARAVRVVAPFEIAEIGRREKLVLAARLVLELFLDENVLFVNGISFAQSLCKGREKLRELVVTVDIRGVFCTGFSIFKMAEYSPLLVYNTPMPSVSSTE